MNFVPASDTLHGHRTLLFKGISVPRCKDCLLHQERQGACSVSTVRMELYGADFGATQYSCDEVAANIIAI